MRTTLTIDDDVLAAVKERARREGVPAGTVLSALARQALTRSADRDADAAAAAAFHGFAPLPNRGRAVSNALVDELREDEGE